MSVAPGESIAHATEVSENGRRINSEARQPLLEMVPKFYGNFESARRNEFNVTLLKAPAPKAAPLLRRAKMD